MNSIKRLNVLLAVIALSGASSFAQAHPGAHKHASHHHVAASTQAAVDREPTPEEAAKAIDMVYNDNVAAMHSSNPNADLFNCNCTIYNQGQ